MGAVNNLTNQYGNFNMIIHSAGDEPQRVSASKDVIKAKDITSVELSLHDLDHIISLSPSQIKAYLIKLKGKYLTQTTITGKR